MEKLVFQMDNDFEDYYPLYPEVNKSLWSSPVNGKLIKFLTGFLLLMLAISIFFTLKEPMVRKEYGYSWALTIIVSFVLILAYFFALNRKKKVITFVKELADKGSAQVTVDKLGIEVKFRKEIKLMEWDKNGQLFLESTYIMMNDLNGNSILIIPKGKINDQDWSEIQEKTVSILKSRMND